MIRSLNLDKLNQEAHRWSSQDIIDHGIKRFGDRLSFASSFGLEDMVLLHMLKDYSIDIFYIDTGRLPIETYQLIEDAEKRYGNRFRSIHPEPDELSRYVAGYGINGFYQSVEARTACCHVRKVRPLARALDQQHAWFAGLRAEQSSYRSTLAFFEDDGYNRVRINPLKNWRWQDLWDYIDSHQVPFNRLHKQGYPSIGCQPCSRAISPGEDFRSGRWWWEKSRKKECGLHNHRRQEDAPE
ncbi:phosphoadenylyl-sulfate reductase [Pseudobacteriovorax antillogorgiicola]|uniref:Adenosine 5'-phosphosulfate reductase n=1 Tax=Pseudobacteriovorax antillogorgiicola TaxID=1513793 RepID=A0A1Y6CTF4_9BACT|nr:phosphoadenylyl-sulfate reductase [Pseudobacteriovorax antillogorgiicola]TCS44592.1 phosphoadenosine phosphosulfate reductase [Pseudobacteriovorax antillogorgiicola]SMF78111.1 phosphoadenosine phosphosulfate reductase [Pseudobacteriovorax antillogorgiicola]